MDAIDKNGVSRSAHDLLMDIQWNCEHCTARLMYEHKTAPYSDSYPCEGCRLSKYGYGAEAKRRHEPCL